MDDTFKDLLKKYGVLLLVVVVLLVIGLLWLLANVFISHSYKSEDLIMEKINSNKDVSEEGTITSEVDKDADDSYYLSESDLQKDLYPFVSEGYQVGLEELCKEVLQRGVEGGGGIEGGLVNRIETVLGIEIPFENDYCLSYYSSPEDWLLGTIAYNACTQWGFSLSECLYCMSSYKDHVSVYLETTIGGMYIIGNTGGYPQIYSIEAGSDLEQNFLNTIEVSFVKEEKEGYNVYYIEY